MNRSSLTVLKWVIAAMMAGGLVVGWRMTSRAAVRPLSTPGTHPLVDVQKLRLVAEPDRPRVDRHLEADVLVAGGGLGGVAAALGACERGRSVVLTEETDWLGGQMAAQGVAAPDDHRYIETFGGTRLYYELRKRIRGYYADRYRLTGHAARDPYLSPGAGWVSRLTFEPRAAAAAIDEMIEPYRRQGLLTVLRRHRPVGAEVTGNQVLAVTFRDLDQEEHARVRARYVLDATEMGDLLPLTGTEYVAGAESRAETGEPRARKDGRRIDCVQSFGYPFALEYAPGAGVPTTPPARYAEFLKRQPYTFAHNDGSKHPPTFQMFGPGTNAGGPFFSYRRALATQNFEPGQVPNDVAVILFAGNDYHWGWLVDQPAEKMLATLREAKDLARGFAYWLQHDAPRDEGGKGYPELRLRPDVMGSEDGFSKYPYIREARRIAAVKTVREQDIGVRFRAGDRRAALFGDSVGIGWHGVDLHPGACGEALAAQQTRPFQIPLGALIPKRVENLLPACKNLGVTHIANGAYRMHPTEWNIGESAGRLAAFCIENEVTPRAIDGDPDQLHRLQAYLTKWGIPLFWLVDTPLDHLAFSSSQLLSTWGLWPAAPNHLEFRPDEWVTASEARALLTAAGTPAAQVDRILGQAGLSLPEASTPRADLARAWLAGVYPAEE